LCDFIRLALLCYGSHFGIFLVVIVSQARNFYLFPQRARNLDRAFGYMVISILFLYCRRDATHILRIPELDCHF